MKMVATEDLRGAIRMLADQEHRFSLDIFEIPLGPDVEHPTECPGDLDLEGSYMAMDPLRYASIQREVKWLPPGISPPEDRGSAQADIILWVDWQDDPESTRLFLLLACCIEGDTDD